MKQREFTLRGTNLTTTSDEKDRNCQKKLDSGNNLAICCNKYQDLLHGCCANIDTADISVLAKYVSVQRICKNYATQPCNLIKQDQFNLLIQKLEVLVDQRNNDNDKLLEIQHQIKDMTATIQSPEALIDTKPTFAEKTKDNAAIPAQDATKQC